MSTAIRFPFLSRFVWPQVLGGLLLLAFSSQATYYWDLNGTTPGAGGATPAGTWDTTSANWNDSALGTNAPQAWSGNSDAVFSAGGDATGAFTVTISTSTTTQYVGSVTVEEGTITFGPGKVALTGNAGNSGTAKFDVKAGAAASFSGTGSGYLTGTNGLNKLGDGALWMGSTEYYQGNTYLDGGICYMRTYSGTTDKSPFGNSGASTIYMQNGAGIVAGVPASGTAVILPATYTLSLGSTGGGLLGASNDLTFQAQAAITGSGQLTIGGLPGTVELSNGANNYAGGTTISQGKLKPLHNNALGTGAVTISAGTGNQLILSTAGLNIGRALVINGGGVTGQGALHYSPTSGSATYSGSITINGLPNSGGHFASGAGGELILSGPITSASTQVRIRAGKVRFSNSGSSYANLAIQGNATNVLGVHNAIPIGATLDMATVASGNSVLDLNGYNQQLAGLTKNAVGATATVDNTATGTAPELKLNIASANDFAGAIRNTAGTVALTKIGSGTLTLSGASTYAGATTVSVGTLTVNGSIGSGAVSVQSGAVVGGSGSIGGVVTVQSGGTISPGSQVGEVGGDPGGADKALAGSVAAQPVRIYYLGEQGDLVAYYRPDITDPTSALAALSVPPSAAEAGQQLSSGVLVGTQVLGMLSQGGTTIVEFSPAIIGSKLDDGRLETIFQQVRATLGQFGLAGSLRLQSEGRLLSDFLPPKPKVAASQAEAAVPKATGALAGKKISLSPGHGRYWHGDAWYYDRGVYCAPLNREDDHNLEIMKYLDAFLAQDGATTKQYRCFNKSYGTHSSGVPWWQMSAAYWLKQAGYPCSIYASDTGDCNLGTGANEYSDTVRSRPLAADYDNTDVHISLHSNGYAGDCTGTGCPNGTVTYYEGTSTEHQSWWTVSRNLATSVQGALVSAIHTKYTDSTWRDRGAADSAGSFAETRMPDRAAILIELAFHDTCDRDGLYLQDHFFRSTTMWGVYKGVCDYFGVAPTWDYYSYEVVSHTLPDTMTPGQTVSAQVTVRNRGVLWNDAEQFRLGAVGDSDPFGATTRYNVGAEIDTGATKTFTLTLTAPLTPGTYTSDWRMLREAVTWFGPTVSKAITVVSSAPVITSQPQSQAVVAGSPASFNVAVGGTAPFTYQWRFNGANISGATQSATTISSVQTTNAGSYSVVISNSFGNATSADAVLTVITVPLITGQPQPQTVVEGSSANFSVVAVGPGTLSYQWRCNGTNLAGATLSALTLNNVQTNSAGSYSVLVTNGFGATPSADALLTVVNGPQIVVQPQSQTVVAGGSATFSVTATGPAPLSYQWQRNGANISGATLSSYSRANVQASDVGLYSVVVSNPYGTAVSQDVSLALSLIGKLTVGGMTWNSGGSYNWEIADASGTVGIGYDTIDASAGTVTVAATSGNRFNLKLISLSGDTSGDVANFDNNSSYAWTLASAAAVSGFSADKFAVDSSQFVNDLAGGAFSVESSPLRLRFSPNHAPTAGATNYFRVGGAALTIGLADLLATRTADSDGDPRLLAFLQSPGGLMKSARGYTLATNSTAILYTNTTDNAPDSFDYIVLDSRAYRPGDTKRYATNTIAIQVAEPFTPITITTSGGDSLTMAFYGIPGGTYLLQRSSNLVQWADVLTNIAPASGPDVGLLQFTDIPPHTPAFYRARLP